ncbi:recombinase family protein [Streptomyces iakyrus]|uniref:recombinase family protein n=1 Tax=Streptomyces iakyrus TaxID=68219 RepID=UPI003800A2AD
MKTTARVRRVGACIRISDDREGAGLGVKRQLEDCRLLSTSLGWNVVEVYDDNDRSASNRLQKRKGYHRMLAGMQSGHIDAAIAWHPGTQSGEHQLHNLQAPDAVRATRASSAVSAD